jgi:hypothetical protein
MPEQISYKQYLNALRSYINESRQIIKELKSIKLFVENSHTDANTIKTAGTVSGLAATVAVAGLLFAPLTGGLSTLVSGVAIGGSIGSVAIGVGTSFMERADGKAAMKRIEKCQADHESSVNRLRHETGKILKIVHQLVEKGINFEVATISTLTFLSNIHKSGAALFDSLKAVASIENALKIGQIQKLLAPTGIRIAKSLQGGLSVTFPSIQAVEKLTEAQLKAYASLAQGPEMLLGQTLSTIGKAVFVVQIFFSVADVALLIKSWTSDHPLIDPIINFINQLEACIESTENQLNALEIFRMG